MGDRLAESTVCTTMRIVSIPLDVAQRLALNAQLLHGQTKRLTGKRGVVQTFSRLGYIQIDTIAVIQRAHHHVLWTRQPDYNPDLLHALQAQDRQVFEYWGHALAYLPMSDYRYFVPRMEHFPRSQSRWITALREQSAPLIKPILTRIREEGPLGAKDFEAPVGKKRGTWWDWKPAKHALELLFWRGDLMITERRNFQKIYDLTERVLPSGIDTSHPHDDEMGTFFVRRALAAYGVAQEKEICTFMQPNAVWDAAFQRANKKAVSKALTDLIQDGEVVPLHLKEIGETPYYALADTLQNTTKRKQQAHAVFLLSPFDNLIIQRDRTKRLFGFDYSLECYVPAAKRKHGYFVLPILWGERFVGRLDPKADRKTKTLVINSLTFEPVFTDFDALLPALVDRLKSFARFNQCETVKLGKVVPAKIKSKLDKALK